MCKKGRASNTSLGQPRVAEASFIQFQAQPPCEANIVGKCRFPVGKNVKRGSPSFNVYVIQNSFQLFCLGGWAVAKQRASCCLGVQPVCDSCAKEISVV